MTETIWWDELQTPFGAFGFASTDRGLLRLLLPEMQAQREREIERLAPYGELRPGSGQNAPAMQQIQEYLAGDRKVFDLDLDQRGTAFQRAVWDAVYDVPWGKTVSYAEIARRIERPKAVRAVGAANGANPHAIIVPCHRIIGSDGSLTGYGGGLELKERLLALEGVAVQQRFSLV